MKLNFGHASRVWIAFGFAMFAVAIWLTGEITWTEGGTLEHGAARARKPPFLVRLPWSPPEQPALYAGVFALNDASDTGDYGLSYREDPSGEGSVLFDYPIGASPVFVISELAPGQSCEVLQDFPPGASPPDLHAAITPFDAGNTNLFRVAVRPSEYPAFLSCRIRIASHSDAFMTRRMEFKSFDPLKNSYLITSPDLTSVSNVADQFRGLHHIPELKLSMRIPGAKDLEFSSENAMVDEETGETWRIFRAGEGFATTWDDVYRQQLRDILLILIGTLIGVGVTVLIEGLKPTVEAWFGGEPGAPRKRRREQARPRQPAKTAPSAADSTRPPNSP